MLAFLETINPELEDETLPYFEEDSQVLLFFKYYNPGTRIMAYCGHLYASMRDYPSKILDYVF